VKPPNTQWPEEAVEALARHEFDRLERGDLRVRGGPLPWEKCEPHLREEMLTWARDALAALGPYILQRPSGLSEEERERVSKIADELVVQAMGAGYPEHENLNADAAFLRALAERTKGGDASARTPDHAESEGTRVTSPGVDDRSGAETSETSRTIYACPVGECAFFSMTAGVCERHPYPWVSLGPELVPLEVVPATELVEVRALAERPASQGPPLAQALREFDAWLSFRPEFRGALAAFRKAFGTDTSAAAIPCPDAPLCQRRQASLADAIKALDRAERAQAELVEGLGDLVEDFEFGGVTERDKDEPGVPSSVYYDCAEKLHALLSKHRAGGAS
jgi:hypothetical protein